VMLTNAEQCEASPGSYWVLNASPECGPVLNASPERDPVLNKVYIRDAHEYRAVCTLSVRVDRSSIDPLFVRRSVNELEGSKANW